MGVYCINAARYLFGSEPVSVTAFSAKNKERRFRRVDEMTSVIMRFPEARLATFTCSFGAASVSRYTLTGTKGSLTAEPAYDYSMGLKHRVEVGDKTTSRSFRKRDQFAAELVYFSQCVLDNKIPEPSGREGLADVRIVRAIYESAKTGSTIKLRHLPNKKRPTMKQEDSSARARQTENHKCREPIRESGLTLISLSFRSQFSQSSYLQEIISMLLTWST